MLTLLVLQGPDKGKRFEIPEEPITIGRESPRVPVTDNTVSRKHSELTPDGSGNWIISDLTSANGTYVNGLRVRQPLPLKVGDQIRVGRTLMVVGVQQGVSHDTTGNVTLDGEDDGVDSAIMHTVLSSDDSMILAVPEPSAAAMTNLQILYQLGAALGSAFDVDQAMQVVMDLVFERVKADRGIILLLKDGQLVPAVVRSREESRNFGTAKPHSTSASAPSVGSASGAVSADSVNTAASSDPLKDVFPASSTIIRHVLTTGEGVLSSNAMVDKRFAKGKSVQDLGIRSAMCVPIKARRFQGSVMQAGGGANQGQNSQTSAQTGGTGVSQGSTQTPVASSVSGLIYIDSSVRNYTYSPDQLRLLSAIGQQAGLAIQNALLYQSAIQGERLAAIGETTAALSHSVKNILQALRGGADVVEMGLRGQNLGQTSKGWGIVSRNLDKIYNLTLNLLAYSKEREPEIAPASLKSLVDDCAELILPTAVERQIVLETDIPSDFPLIPMDTDGMHQVLINLLSNAIDAVEPGYGHIKVRALVSSPTGQSISEDNSAVIEVSDNGSGMTQQMLKHAFELFHSTKGNRGTGLGLAVSKKIITEHHGDITVSSSPGQGTTFTIRLPMSQETISNTKIKDRSDRQSPHLTDLGDAHIE